MVKGHSLPSSILSEYIDRYWFWESENNESITLPQIYPGSGVELIFHYREPFIDYPNSHILCPRNMDKYNLKQDHPIGFISVRFKSWSFPYFTNIPTDKLIDQVVEIKDIWPHMGSCVEEELSCKTNFKDRTAVLNNFFETLLFNNNKSFTDIDWAINYIYYNYNSINIKNLISDTNISSRTFQRRFKSSTGVSAKRFHKISRFQTILKKSLLSRSYPTVGEILSAGYFDQAHFNKDFNSLTGKNPIQIISDKNFLAHFYNTSITD